MMLDQVVDFLEGLCLFELTLRLLLALLLCGYFRLQASVFVSLVGLLQVIDLPVQLIDLPKTQLKIIHDFSVFYLQLHSLSLE